MKKKKKGICCPDGGCFSGGKGRRDDWSSELEYEKDYEKYGREYEREYARLCELQRSLTPEERSKRSEASTTTLDQSTFSRRYSSFDTLEITEERLDKEIKKVSQQRVDEDSDYDVELLENLMKEAEETEVLDRRRRQEEEEEKQRRKNEETARRKKEEEEIQRRRREELAQREREEQEIARRRREREEEEIARRRREELARRKREEEEIAWRKRKDEENARRQRKELARREWEEKEIERRKRQEEENERRQREELARREWEEKEIERRKRQEEEIVRRQREESARKKNQEEEENARRKTEEEKMVRGHNEDSVRRNWEEEENARRKREEGEVLRRQREESARRKLDEEENARRKREELAKREREEEDAARRRREEQARREREQEEIAQRRKEELARREREQEEIAQRRKEELARQKREEEEEIAHRKKEEEEQMEGWQMQQDLSWMSLTQQARNRARGVSMNGDRIDRIQRTDSERYDASASVSGRSTWSEVGDTSKKSMSLREGGWHNEWREVEFLEEEQEEDVKLIRNRVRRGKEVAREDFDDGGSSSTSELPSDEWESGKPTNNPFSSLHLGAGFQRKFQRRQEELLSRFEQQLLAAAKMPKSKFHSRLHSAATIVFVILGVALLFILFLLHLSFIARVRPPGECINERIILNFSATRIRLRGGRYISFREQGVGADRAEHSVVVVHDLLSSRLAGIPGINESLLEEYKVRLVSYDRPGYGQSDSHLGRSYNTSAYDIVEIADALDLGEKFWVVGFGGGGPHVWAAINYLPERLAGVALFAPSGNPYVSHMSKEEIDETWGALTLRQKWMHSIARRFPALLPRLLQRTAVTNSPYVPKNVRLSLGEKDQKWMEQPHVMKAWQEDVQEALRHGCAFPMAEELMLLVNDWGFSLSELPFKERAAKTIFHHVASLFGGEKKPKIYDGPIHIWQGTDDQLVPVTINNVAKRLVEQNDLLELETKSSPVKIHYLPGEGHFSWFWFCDECHRRIFETLFRPNETLEAEEEALPFSSKGFSKDDYEAIVKAFAALKMTSEPYSAEGGIGAAGKTVDNAALTKAREEEFKKLLQTVLRNKKAEDDQSRQQKAQITQEVKAGRLSRNPEHEDMEVHPMTCRATNDALRDKSVLYVCPEDEDDMSDEMESTFEYTHSSNTGPATESNSVKRKENAKDTKNRTGNISTYLEGLSTLVKRLSRNRK